MNGAETADAIFLCAVQGWQELIQSYIEDKCGYDLHATLEQIRPTWRMDESCQGLAPPAISAI